MKTFQRLYERCQTISGDPTEDTLQFFKDEINEGGRMLNAAMSRYFTRRSKKKNLVADRQYYQLPADCIRVISVSVADSSGGRYRPLTKVSDEDAWEAMNYHEQTSNWLSHYFVRGNDEIGLYPIPANAVTNGLKISFEPEDRELSAADFTDGTISITNGDTTVTHSATGFTAAMEGRYFETSDKHRYRIASFTSTSILELEEPYMGATVVGGAVLIGEAFSFPKEYLTATSDYALAGFFEIRNNEARAAYHLKKFELKEKDARQRYAMSSSSNIVGGESDSYNAWLQPPMPLSG